VNLYPYVANNPIMWVDPYGLFTIQNATLVGAGVSLVEAGALIITKAVPILITAGPAGVVGAGVVTVVGGAMIGGGVVITAAGAGYDPFNLFPDPNNSSQTSPCP
jgi:hypothetical protein